MPTLGKGMVPISGQLRDAKRDYIDTRAQALEWTRAEVISKIIDFWLALEAPALSDLDSLRTPSAIPAAARVPLPSWWAKYKGADSTADSKPLHRSIR